MVVNQQVEKRPRGRPQLRCDADTKQLIVEAAAEEFQANGYAGTNICAVAQRAGVSTKTLYRLVPTKADLLESVVRDRIAGFIGEVDTETVVGDGDVHAGLEHILLALGSLTLNAGVIAVTRLVFAESDRFPEIAKTFHFSAVVPVNQMIERWLQRQVDKGRLQIDDVHLASGMLRGMMMMEPQRAVMLGQGAPPDAAEIAERARICAAIFLNGCAR